LIDKFNEEEANKVKELERITNHDVKAVEYFVQNKLSSLPYSKDYIAFIHFGCTSEDINNISYALMIQNGVKAYEMLLMSSDVHPK
jgi:adenylosuccinate lyase